MFFLFFLGCSEKSTDSAVAEPSNQPSQEPSEDTSVEEQQEIVLQEGMWAYSSVSITENECGFPPEVELYLEQSMMSVEYNLNYIAANNYLLTLFPGNGTEVPTTCTLDNTDFFCEDIVFQNPTDESVVIETYSSVGTATSDTRVEGVVHKYHECEGPNCDEIATNNFMTFPCSVTFSYTFNFFD